LVSAGVLEASPHNSQPWRFSVSRDQILLYAVFGRKIGAMDPFEREMFIGLGCALENMVIAAPGAALATHVAPVTAVSSGFPSSHRHMVELRCRLQAYKSGISTQH
jgi:nitroreductase